MTLGKFVFALAVGAGLVAAELWARNDPTAPDIPTLLLTWPFALKDD